MSTLKKTIKFDNNFVNSNDSFSNMSKYELEEIIYRIANTEFVLRKTLNLDKNIRFGVEIEFSGALKSDISEFIYNNFDKWNVVPELSIQQKINGKIYGGEVISPILNDSIDTWLDLQFICNNIKKRDGNNLNCGAHIHFDNSIINNRDKKTLNNLIKMWIINESIIYRFSAGESSYIRNSALSYATPISKEILSKSINTKDLSNVLEEIINIINRDNNFKTYAYETGSTKNYNTIEIRCPNGTFNSTIWQNNINFFVHFLKYVKDSDINISLDDLEQILNYYYKTSYFENSMEMELMKAIYLADKIYSNNLNKIYFLRQYLKPNDIEKINDNYKQKKKTIYI